MESTLSPKNSIPTPPRQWLFWKNKKNASFLYYVWQNMKL